MSRIGLRRDERERKPSLERLSSKILLLPTRRCFDNLTFQLESSARLICNEKFKNLHKNVVSIKI